MSQRIALSRGQVALVDDADFAWLNRWKWYCNEAGYAARNLDQVTPHTILLMHRVILDAQPGELVDHINGDTLDNRRENLRLVDGYQNQHNRRATQGRPYKGVSWYKRKSKWQARIQAYGRSYHLGYYKDPLEAALVYDAASQHLHGVYGRLNFPERAVSSELAARIAVRLNE